ncbi:MAG: hypothetical protein VB031_06105 [Eubacteriaceae bacterium]|nr:hypothetical protein [Eubacteriaceae bacterium]
MSLLNAKQKQVYDILLTPICCDKKYNKISKKRGTVLSGQKYYSNADEDMSDFAVGFYEIIYKNILKENVLDTEGHLYFEEFAGDTMNSFQSIANITPDAGNTKNNRTDYKEWPSYLQYYHDNYHCLANFWLIPMKLGRRSMKLNKFDSLDLFLDALEEDYDGEISCYEEYRNSISTFESFCEIHFVGPGRERSVILNSYKSDKKEGQKIVGYAMDDIKNRAYRMATSNHSNGLWEYFNYNNLLK